MELIAKACSPFLNSECCRSLFVNFDFKNKTCVSLLISRIIGFGLIGFSSILKVPQILQILINKSGKGLSITSIFMEVVANVLSFAYHRQKKFPFATYGETLLILIQNLIISFFVTHYAENYSALSWFSFIIPNISLLFGVEKAIVSDRLMNTLWAICLPLSLAYKVPQIVLTARAKCKGELSSLSCFLTLMGSCGRVFTTIREVKDWSVLLMYILNVLLNGTIWIQSLVLPKKRKSDDQ